MVQLVKYGSGVADAGGVPSAEVARSVADDAESGRFRLLAWCLRRQEGLIGPRMLNSGERVPVNGESVA